MGLLLLTLLLYILLSMIRLLLRSYYIVLHAVTFTDDFQKNINISRVMSAILIPSDFDILNDNFHIFILRIFTHCV